MGRGRLLLLCEREKRWKCLGEIVPIYIAIWEREGTGGRKDFFFFTTITTTMDECGL